MTMAPVTTIPEEDNRINGRTKKGIFDAFVADIRRLQRWFERGTRCQY